MQISLDENTTLIKPVTASFDTSDIVEYPNENVRHYRRFGHVQIGQMNWYNVPAIFARSTNSAEFDVYIGNVVICPLNNAKVGNC